MFYVMFILNIENVAIYHLNYINKKTIENLGLIIIFKIC